VLDDIHFDDQESNFNFENEPTPSPSTRTAQQTRRKAVTQHIDEYGNMSKELIQNLTALNHNVSGKRPERKYKII
jgi:hypothetical protein